tara:strand:- start:4587 stop:4751 length:165 start_codon:yes stop_codon:yes gene_type:complete
MDSRKTKYRSLKIKTLIGPMTAINGQIEVLKNHNLSEKHLRTHFFCDIAKNFTP